MYKVAVIGDRDSVLGFKALGLHVVFAEELMEARRALHELAKEDYAVIYITEDLAVNMSADIDRYKDAVTPAIILMPGKSGSLGIGLAQVNDSVERAVGANIL